MKTDNSKPLVMLIDHCMINKYVNRKMLQLYGFSDHIISYRNLRKAIDFIRDTVRATHDLRLLPGYIFLSTGCNPAEEKYFIDEFNKLPEYLRDHMRLILLTNSFRKKEVEVQFEKANVFASLSMPLIRQDIEQIHFLSERLQVPC